MGKRSHFRRWGENYNFWPIRGSCPGKCSRRGLGPETMVKRLESHCLVYPTTRAQNLFSHTYCVHSVIFSESRKDGYSIRNAVVCVANSVVFEFADLYIDEKKRSL